MTHLIPMKCSFHTCTCAIVFTLSMPCFKKAPSVSNSSLFVKATQPIKWACRFELPRTPIWPNPMFCKWHPIIFQWIINQPKSVLNKQHVMLMIITNIKMIFPDHIVWLRSVIPTINARLSMSIQYMYEDGNLFSDNTHFVSLSENKMCNSQQSLPPIGLFLAQKPHKNA